jgi:RNA polymerase sigma-70 factor (ECF subfamily)
LVAFLRARFDLPTEAEDIAQAAFARLWARSDELSDQNLSALMFVTARNLATDLVRRCRRSPVGKSIDAPYWHGDETVADELPSAERTLIARRRVSMLQDLLDDLPPKCREAFVSRNFRDQDYPEIARAMGVTQSMVRKNVRRAEIYCAARFSELETGG